MLFAIGTRSKSKTRYYTSGGEFVPGVQHALKFSTPSDIELFISERGLKGVTVISVDPAEMDRLEVQAQHAWNHRDCHKHNGSAA